MANKPPKINTNVPAWMLPQGMRSRYARTPPRTNFTGILEKQGKSSSGRTVRSGGSDYNPRGQGMKRISGEQAKRLAQYAPIIQRCARKYNVPTSLICGVILQESGGNSRAVSHCGAQGLMQLMPATGRRFGVSNAMDPGQNIEGGTRYLSFLKERFKGNVPLMLAAYNAGEGNVAKYGNRIPPFAETQNYVPNVIAYANTVHDLLASGASIDSPQAITNNSSVPRFMKFV